MIATPRGRHGQRRSRDAKMDKGRERNCIPLGDDIDSLERTRIVFETRIDLEHHVILIQRPVDCRYFSLTEGIVQGIIDLLRRDAKASGSIAIDRGILFQAIHLLIAVHIAELWQRLQAFNTLCPQL